MKAAILVKSKAPLVVEEVIPPNELLPGHVFVEIEYSGICGAKINEIDAVKGPDQFLPHLLFLYFRSDNKTLILFLPN